MGGTETRLEFFMQNVEMVVGFGEYITKILEMKGRLELGQHFDRGSALRVGFLRKDLMIAVKTDLLLKKELVQKNSLACQSSCG